MDDESIENRCAPFGDGRVGVPSAIPMSADDGLFGLEGERGGKNANAVAGVMIDTGARMLIKLPSEMLPTLFPPGANVRLMRERLSLWNLEDFVTTRRKVETN